MDRKFFRKIFFLYAFFAAGSCSDRSDQSENPDKIPVISGQDQRLSKIPKAPNPNELGDLFGSEAALKTKILEYHKLANAIVFDGQMSDWNQLPTYDVLDDALDALPPKIPELEIIKTGLIPIKNAFIILIKTKAKPILEIKHIWMDIDFRGSNNPDLRIGLNSAGNAKMDVFEEKTILYSKTITGLTVKVDEIIEIKIPFSSIAKYLPLAMTKALSPHFGRPFVRIFPYSFDGQKILSQGPMAAAYYITDEDYSFKSTLPNSVFPSFEMNFFLKGNWLISSGAFKSDELYVGWHYQFERQNPNFAPLAYQTFSALDQSPSYGETILCPLPAKILKMDLSHTNLDFEIATTSGPSSPGTNDGDLLQNYVVLDSLRGHQIRFGSLKIDSSKAILGQTLQIGNYLAAVGNSFFLRRPHLEVSVFTDSLADVLPLALTNVDVSLNPSPHDPFKITYGRWMVREGYFVSSSNPIEP